MSRPVAGARPEPPSRPATRPARGGVESETAFQPRDARLERRRAAAKAELLEHRGEMRLGGALDQQVDVALARHPAALFPVALPLAAVHHVAPLEGLAQRDDERARLALAGA